MYLLDTNILLEVILGQEQYLVAENALNRLDIKFFISDFSLFSIGILLIRQKKYSALSAIFDDIKRRNISIIRLDTGDLIGVSQTCSEIHLDFDDGYQYVLAKKYHLRLVSFDHHFDNTPLGRVHPRDLTVS